MSQSGFLFVASANRALAPGFAAQCGGRGEIAVADCSDSVWYSPWTPRDREDALNIPGDGLLSASIHDKGEFRTHSHNWCDMGSNSRYPCVMHCSTPQQGLTGANQRVAEGRSTFTFKEVETHLEKTKTATANRLKRMAHAGLIERVRRAHYAARQLGDLGTAAAAEDVALSVGAALKGLPHRIAYRSARYEHDLLVHPSRSIQVATERRVRTKTISGHALQIIIESPETLQVGRVPLGMSYLSDRHRAILDAAQRPGLVGGLEVLSEAFTVATPDLRADTLRAYARRLDGAAALRRLGSLADALALEPVAGAFQPITPITADLNLKPGTQEPTLWRDSRWRVRWSRCVEALRAVIGQCPIGHGLLTGPRATGCRRPPWREGLRAGPRRLGTWRAGRRPRPRVQGRDGTTALPGRRLSLFRRSGLLGGRGGILVPPAVPIEVALAALTGAVDALTLTDREPRRIGYRGPVGRQRHLKLDCADDELVLEVDAVTALRRWLDLPEIRAVRGYSLAEMAGEKPRCAMQRMQCRNLFDLWRLFTDAGVDPRDATGIFLRKTHHRHWDAGRFAARYHARPATVPASLEGRAQDSYAGRGAAHLEPSERAGPTSLQVGGPPKRNRPTPFGWKRMGLSFSCACCAPRSEESWT